MLRRAGAHAHRLAHLDACRSLPVSAWIRQCIEGESPNLRPCCLSQARGYEARSERGESDKSVRVEKLADEILQLNLLELSDLTEIFQQRLGIPSIGAMSYGAPAAAAPGAAPQAAPAEAPAEEQTDFDLKLDSFEAAAKIKVIKEIRGLSDLGLKEAKELVEKAPVTIKTGLKKEEAEELKKKLEAVGGKVSLV